MSVEESINELRQLIADQNISGTQVSALFREMGFATQKRASVQVHKAAPVTKLTTIVRTYTCATCGSRYTHAIKITDADTLCGVDKSSGQVIIADAKRGPYIIDSWTRSCNRCDDYISKLSKEELIERYKQARMFVPLPNQKGE
ncbi:MAG: hypothetical protein WC455_21320 [Dehalococcoidia bacterium]|jgi:hypothetical protein